MSNSVGTGFSPSATGKSGWSTGGLGDLVGYIPGLGINILIGGNKALARPSLGGGLRGYMPQPLIVHDNSDEFAQTRFLLKDAWNTSSISGSSNPKRMVGPFRAVNNAGDILSRQNYSCGGTCQSYQSRPGLNGLRQRFGSISVVAIKHERGRYYGRRFRKHRTCYQRGVHLQRVQACIQRFDSRNDAEFKQRQHDHEHPTESHVL